VYFLYSLILIIGAVLAIPFLIFKLLTDHRYRDGMFERFGFLPDIPPARDDGRIWIHCASVGEVTASVPLVQAIVSSVPAEKVFMSTTTSTGREKALNAFPYIGGVFIFPADFPPIARASLKAVSPRVIIILETEFWPNFIREAKMLGIPVLLSNGRVSEKSFGRYGLIKGFVKQVLSGIDSFCVLTEADRDRIVALGADPARIEVTGNIKYDAIPDAPSSNGASISPEIALLKESFGGRKLFIAGSTHRGEETVVLNAFVRLSADRPGMLLLLAPRHLERLSEIERLASARGLKTLRRSAVGATGSARPDVLILDTLGELLHLYQFGDIIFVGGSLAPKGGHNVLEPALRGKAVLFGPHMENFKDARNILLQSGAGIVVANEDDIFMRTSEILADPEKFAALGALGTKAILEKRGATRRNMRMIKKYIS
jgi:3-deoxy-D-manno-octulosonic-acid transferase